MLLVFFSMLSDRLTLRVRLVIILIRHLLIAKIMKKLLILLLTDISTGHPEM